jgi:hypothetical protein
MGKYGKQSNPRYKPRRLITGKHAILKIVPNQAKKLLKYVYELERIAVDQGYDVEKLGFNSELQAIFDKLTVD